MRALRLPNSSVFPQVKLTAPLRNRFVLMAAAVDHRPSIFPPSRAKRRLLDTCKQRCVGLCGIPGVVSAHVFRALLIPPGRGDYLKRRPDLHVARFDVVALVEFEPDARDAVFASTDLHCISSALAATSTAHCQIEATNMRRIDSVDHTRSGIFLFNYFVASDLQQNLDVWNYTAGWFQKETGLDNSTVLVPIESAHTPFTLINHCRWDHLSDILPALLFKRAFRQFVLESFDANDVAAVPILYRLV